jgi:hypothetical protein
LFVLPSGSTDNGTRVAFNDIHFSVLCFNNSNGDVIMCARILKSKKDISQVPANIKLGIDRTIKISNGQSKYNTVEVNLRKDVMIGGPTYTYLGKTNPCFIGYSANASFTSQVLAEMLAVFDSCNLFDCDNEKSPLLLINNHHS